MLQESKHVRNRRDIHAGTVKGLEKRVVAQPAAQTRGLYLDGRIAREIRCYGREGLDGITVVALEGKVASVAPRLCDDAGLAKCRAVVIGTNQHLAGVDLKLPPDVVVRGEGSSHVAVVPLPDGVANGKLCAIRAVERDKLRSAQEAAGVPAVRRIPRAVVGMVEAGAGKHAAIAQDQKVDHGRGVSERVRITLPDHVPGMNVERRCLPKGLRASCVRIKHRREGRDV